MLIGQALDLVSRYDSLRNPLTSLGDYLDPELISRCLAESGTVTLRKRRLPLEMMVWCIVGMALERKEPLHQMIAFTQFSDLFILRSLSERDHPVAVFSRQAPGI
ncbi:transposase domain-containing protein [Escherichia coli]|uniref:transposase domain-containing protein n=2 Tax=Escherichia coli TaxID=562 RepID=UPI003D9A14C8